MSFLRRHFKLLAIGAACAVMGAGASAIATAGATGTTTTAKGSAKSANHPVRARARARRALLRRGVQGSAVLATKSGFVTVTFNRGFVQSVNGNQLTIREGTKKATYKTVTVTIPAGAKVRDNGKTASLSQLSAGQRVSVVKGPKRTLVLARTPKP